jgi:hypothetical protein
VIADDGRIFVTDCGTAAGTWLASRDGGGRTWEPVRQAFAARDDVLRLGEHERSLSDILSPIAGSAPGTDDSSRREPNRPSGRLRRDPTTGEIVRGRS